MPPRTSHETSPYRPLPVRHLPFIRWAIDELGIREIVDAACPPDPRHKVSDGDCVAVMILNVLCGRVALYDMGAWLADTDVDLLLGEDVDPSAFNDDRLASALDRLFDAGTESVFADVAQRVLRRPEIERSYSVHTDTTSVKLQGAYEEKPSRPWPEGSPVPARGFSKDRRPDLKQLIFGLSTHGPTRIPIGFSVLDGNSADVKANRFHVEYLSQLLPAEDDVLLVGDCKFVDAQTLGAARMSGFHYVSLLPHTFALRRRLVEAARVENRASTEVGRFVGRTKADPERIYRAFSEVHDFAVLDPATGQTAMVPHRFVVVHSSTQLEEFESTIADRVRKADARLREVLDKLLRKDFACEADLAAEVERVSSGADYHRIRPTLSQVELTKPRKGPGRPRKSEPKETEKVWRLTAYDLTRDEDRIEAERFHAAHFVLLSDHVDAATWSDQRIFSAWREQQSIEGHAGFRWLKGVADVAPVFLKLPHRISALALVFMFALMVRNWIEATARRVLKATNTGLPNFNDKPVPNPTAENIFYLLRSVTILARVDDQRIVHREVHFLDHWGRAVLKVFGLTEATYLTPPPRKITTGTS